MGLGGRAQRGGDRRRRLRPHLAVDRLRDPQVGVPEQRERRPARLRPHLRRPDVRAVRRVVGADAAPCARAAIASTGFLRGGAGARGDHGAVGHRAGVVVTRQMGSLNFAS
ncbi:hypothetical protein MSMEI_1287 [Mycolicibacterium smegmatis MC2 155]|uniref:Uncharacterized protein n=1 Tax=Mycolicibacterium smegmatis (strain ATCC 700084 / mc(2)155) TaxID=246196 RepID=I7FFX0_MYCS2|nr:hypothetical protein MSMEI_1287 [Mycolicibacterium smegmatis MC2 155]